MFLMGFLWSPITIHIWAVKWDLIGYIVLGLNTCWWLMMILSLSFINAVEFGGADTLVEFLFGKKKKQPNYPPQLITTGMYGYVRHPVYFFLLCGIWLVPLMTVGHMILAAGLTLYIVVAVNLFEEAKLIEEFGESYRKYQRDVPYQFIPLIL
jgi:protein-S-isoprenylcysteine O-methyltransferase Ste14